MPMKRNGRGVIIACMVSLAAMSCGWLVAASAAAESGKESLRSTLSRLSSSEKPSIVVHAVSLQRHFPSVLDKEHFEKLVDRKQDDVVVRIGERGLVRKLIRLLSDLELGDAPGQDLLDVRYRFDFFIGDQLLVQVYASEFGYILYQGEILKAASGRKWLRQAWDLIGEDVLVPE